MEILKSADPKIGYYIEGYDLSKTMRVNLGILRDAGVKFPKNEKVKIRPASDSSYFYLSTEGVLTMCTGLAIYIEAYIYPSLVTVRKFAEQYISENNLEASDTQLIELARFISLNGNRWIKNIYCLNLLDPSGTYEMIEPNLRDLVSRLNFSEVVLEPWEQQRVNSYRLALKQGKTPKYAFSI